MSSGFWLRDFRFDRLSTRPKNIPFKVHLRNHGWPLGSNRIRENWPLHRMNGASNHNNIKRTGWRRENVTNGFNGRSERRFATRNLNGSKESHAGNGIQERNDHSWGFRKGIFPTSNSRNSSYRNPSVLISHPFFLVRELRKPVLRLFCGTFLHCNFTSVKMWINFLKIFSFPSFLEGRRQK